MIIVRVIRDYWLNLRWLGYQYDIEIAPQQFFDR
jgi:hypothetical protein